ERFERQKDVLGDSVQKYLSFGDVESARRVVTLSFQEYSRIQQPYWKSLWLSTLDTPIDMLRYKIKAIDRMNTLWAGDTPQASTSEVLPENSSVTAASHPAYEGTLVRAQARNDAGLAI